MGGVGLHGIVQGSGEPVRAPSAEEVLEELQRISSSKAFRNAAGQLAFLRYTVEEFLQGRGDQIKEYTIGLEAFHRKESFDPRRDNTVRVKAQKLRWSLAKYYEEEGREDPIHIEFPIGSYKPTFRFSAPAAPAELIPPAKGAPADSKPVAPAAPAEITNQPGTATPAEHATPSDVAVASLGQASAEKRPAQSNGINWRVALILVLALLIGSAVYLQKYGTAKISSSTTPSIAVLPFRALGSAAGQEFFSDGLTEDLTASLAQIPGLRVVAPTSAFLYKGEAVDVRKVGRELSVGAVLEGSVQRVDDRVRVTAQLSDTKNGLHVWSSSYDKEMKNLLGIQREISASITAALGVKFSESKAHDGDQTRTVPTSEGYQDYLKGKYFLARPSLKNLNTAVAYFQQAIGNDPSYAPSYAGLAQSYASIPPYMSATSADIALKTRDAASKALALDSTLGEAHIALGIADSYDYQWQSAEQEFKQAVQFSPGVASTHLAYGRFLTRLGRFDEAISELQKARVLDPVSAPAHLSSGRPLYFMRRYDDALKQYRDALELDPNSATAHEYVGIIYVLQGMQAEGISEIDLAYNQVKDNVWYLGLLGWADALAGRTAPAREILNQLLHRAEREDSPAMAIGHVYIGLGNKDQALRWLKKAVDSRNVNASLQMKFDPIYDLVRRDPRFNDLLRQMNLN
jgi:TolB-like protein/Flp pilus assembly protein TadD